jgi:alpha-2-macroglobulin
MVMAVYDRSVEYISGGSNIGQIRPFFWKWRRSHRPNIQTSLDRVFHNIIKSGETGMSYLGVFGHLIADEFSRTDQSKLQSVSTGLTRGGGGPGKSKNGGARDRSLAAPAAPAARMMKKSEARDKDATSYDFEDDGIAGDLDTYGAEQPTMAQPQVRTKFADTAYWNASIKTDREGMAEVEFTMPENLTGWKIRTWGMGHGTKVGDADAEVVTVKNLLLRMQAPRFFVEKDEVVLSANIHNYLDSKKTVKAVLELDGENLEPLEETVKQVEIEANGEMRVDWMVKVVREGEAVVRMKALTDEESDAMEMKFPVFVHGMLKTESFSGVIRPEESRGKIEFVVPQERRPEQSRIEVRYSPTLAGAMVDALPYLVEYPYGCTEQTLNRFLPTVMTQKVLKDMGLDLKDIQNKRSNLNAQEIGDDLERAKQWKRWKRNPVFDEKTVDKMVKRGVRKLTNMQLSDGGWGWFSGWGEYSYPHTTAYVVHGLQVAKDNGVKVSGNVVRRGIAWLENYQRGEVRKLKNAPSEKIPYKLYADNLDAFVYMVLADAGKENKEMREYIYRDRLKLAVYGMSMAGLAFHKQGHKDKVAMIVRNIDQYLVMDEENQTAYLNLGNGNYWWYWYGSEYEAQAYYLKLLAATQPKSDKASWLVKYLLNNRKHATYWNSTRDTAVCIEAFADFIRASGEDKPDMTVEVVVDGQVRKSVKIDSSNLFTFDNQFVLEGTAVDSGKHTVELRKTGKGPIYFNAYVTNFTLEDFITRAGLEIKVNRKYYKLVREDKTVKVSGSRGQALDQKVEKYRREELENLDLLKSGDLVEIELTIESKNDYEYIIFEDMKAAGFEPVQVRSGYNGNGLGAYMELRDEKVALFVRRLARGKHSTSYRMRAEIPGKFSALPTRAYAMYAPELKANSDEIKLRVED